MNTQAIQDLQSVTQEYFQGIFEGDLDSLRNAIHIDCLLYGDIKGAPYRKTLEEYLSGVGGRKSPKELGETFQMDIASIEVAGNNAIVTAKLNMLGHEYFDFLSFSKLENQWWIVNKLFTEHK